MARVRPFVEEDIPRIIELNTKLFPGSSGLSPESQRANFTDVCLRNPWRVDGIESLVYADSSGRITGFVAIVPHTMLFHDRKITVATLQHLMVDPESRSPFAAIELFRTALAGRQDISISDMSVDISRRIWEKCGGKTVFAYSTYWKFPLRPFTHAATHVGQCCGFPAAAKVTSPAFRLLDAGVSRLPWNPWHLPVPETVEGEITTEKLVELIEDFSSRYSLRPEWDTRTLGWLLDIVTKQERWGSLQKAAVCTKDGEILGWFLYYLNTAGSCEVLQIGAREKTIDRVISHLCYHAWRRGALQLAGRMNPIFTRAFTKKSCWFAPGRNWMLVHSREPELTQPIFQADAWLTRLEGDLWLL